MKIELDFEDGDGVSHHIEYDEDDGRIFAYREGRLSQLTGDGLDTVVVLMRAFSELKEASEEVVDWSEGRNYSEGRKRLPGGGYEED